MCQPHLSTLVYRRRLPRGSRELLLLEPAFAVARQAGLTGGRTMPRSKLSFLILGVAAVLFAGVPRLPAQQSSATPESLEKAPLEPAPPANVVISPSTRRWRRQIIPEPVSASNDSQLAGPQARAANFNQTYERTLAKAQDECKTLWSSHTFDWLRKKIPLGDEKPTLSMLTSKDRLRPKDKPRADLAIKTLEQCRQAYAPLYAMLPARDMISGLGAQARCSDRRALRWENYVRRI